MSGSTVLFVGEDETFASNLREALSGETLVHVHSANLDDTVEEGVDCILVEDDPPAVDGVELARRVQSAGVPVLLVCNHTDTDRVETLVGQGVDYVPKTPVALDIIVERVRAAREETAAREWYRTVLEQSSIDLLVLDADGQQTYATPSIAERIGFSAEDLAGLDTLEFLHPEDREAFDAALEDVQERGAGASTTVQYRVRHADDTWHTYESTLTNRLSDPPVEGIIVDAREITERQRLESELEDVFERVDDAFYAVDEQFRFTYVNERAEKLLQAPAEELLGESVWEMYPEATETPAWDAFHEAMETQEPTSYEVYFDPLEFWVEANVYPSETGLSVYFRDVTERKVREQELETRVRQQAVVADLGQRALESENLDDLMADAAAQVSETLDTDYCKVLDLDREADELLLRQGIGWDEGVVGNASVGASEADSQAAYTLASDAPVVVEDMATETRFSGPSLLLDHDVTSGISVIIGSPDDPWGILGTHDTGRRKFSENDVHFVQTVANILATAIDRAARQRELERFETIVQTVGDGVYVLDAESRFTMVNDAYLELTGYTREELLGAHSSEIVGEDLFDEADAIQERLREGEADVLTLETELPTADGGQVPAEAAITRFPLGDGEYGRVGVVRDLSARRRFERTLASLHDATRGFLRDRTRAAVAERVVDTADRTLDMEGIGVFLVDDNGLLRDAAHSDYVEQLFDDLSEYEFGPEDTSLMRAAFDRGEAITLNDVNESDLVHESGTPVRSGIWIPLADHGTLAVLSEEVGAFDDDDRQLAELLAATAAASLDRVEREQALEGQRRRLARLNEFSQALTEAETVEMASESAVEAARETLDLPLSAIEAYDEAAGGLRHVAQTPAVAELNRTSLFTSTNDPVWQAYVDNETVVYDDLLAETDVSADETELRSAIVIPLGEHGVFISGATEPHSFDEDDVSLATILAANTRAALDRVVREQTLRKRTAELEEKTETLQRLNRINELVRSLTQELIQATTRAEVDEAVCNQLARADPYRFVCICDRSPGGGAISIRATAGDDGGYLDTVSPSDPDESPDEPPVVTALRTGEVCVENTVNATPPLPPWRQEALSAGIQSMAAVPIRYRDSTYGVLVVHAIRSSVFTQLEQAVLRELGEMVGYATNALEQRQALVSDSVVELEFAIADPGFTTLTFARETGARFEFETFLAQSEESLKVFFTVYDADPETVIAFAEAEGIEDVNHVTDRDGGHFFEVTIPPDGFLGRMLEYGAQVTELTAEGSEGRVAVELPVSSDVRTFIEMFLSTYEGAELLARRELDRGIQTDQQFESVYRDRLTERQEEVLRTAYASGYFEWPREVTGEEVAEALGVSQPTVNRHLRTSQRKLFELVFGDG